MNRQIRLKSRPAGMPTADNFEAVDSPMPALQDGDVLRGHTVSEVVESRNPAFRAGDMVTGYDGWQQFAMSKGKDLRKLDPHAVPVSTAIGVLGMPGATAYVG